MGLSTRLQVMPPSSKDAKRVAERRAVEAAAKLGAERKMLPADRGGGLVATLVVVVLIGWTVARTSRRVLREAEQQRDD